MTKIEEILNKYRDITRWPEYPEIFESEYIQAMKEYAEWYAKRCLYLADEQINAYNNIIDANDLELPPHD